MIASKTASRHQPMNWRDSIRASDIGHAGSVLKSVKHAASSEPMIENSPNRVSISDEKCGSIFLI